MRPDADIPTTPEAMCHKPPGAISRVLCAPIVALIWVYRLTLSPIVGGQCRFEPTCSRYALEAYKTHGLVRGTRLTGARLLRCHPLHKGGYDPVPLNRWGERSRQEVDAGEPELAGVGSGARGGGEDRGHA